MLNQASLYGQLSSCTPSGFTTLSNQTAAVTFTGQSFSVPANVTVNFTANVTMQGCTILMQNGSMISVTNSLFTLTNNNTVRSLITGCTGGNMSVGIELGSNGRINFTKSDIRHTLTAIKFGTGSLPNQSTITDCKFDANQTCVSLNNLTSLSFLNLSGNIFTGNPLGGSGINLLPPLSLFPDFTRSAIVMTSVSGTLGSLGTSNTVRNMTIGVSGSGGTIIVKNFIFSTNNLNSSSSDSSSGGIGLSGSSGCSFFLTIAPSCSFSSNRRGILLNGANLFVSSASFNGNTTAGIQLTNTSGAVVQGSCTFTSNTNAINSDQSQITVRGNTFTANNRAILSTKSRSVEISQKNIFNNQVVRDIEINNSVNSAYNVIIDDNTFNVRRPSLGSIFVERAALSGKEIIHTKISANTMKIPTTTTGVINAPIRFIHVRALLGATDRAVISNNKITCPYGNGPGGGSTAKTIDGICVFDAADGYFIQNNILNFANAIVPNDTVTSIGIGMIGVTGINNWITNDTITTTLFAAAPSALDSWLRCGVHIDNSPNANVCSNDVLNPRHVYHFLHDCGSIDFGFNNIQSGKFGLEVWNAPFPMSRPHRKNTWTGTYTNVAADNIAPPNPLLWPISSAVPSYLPTSQNPFGWFFTQPDPGNIDVCSKPAFAGELAVERAMSFIKGQFNLSDPVIAWDFERNLLGMLLRFPDAAHEELISTYLHQQEGSTIWQIAKTERLLQEANTVVENQQAQLDDYLSSIQLLSQDIVNLEADAAENPELLYSLEWQTQKSLFIEQLRNKTTAQDELLISIEESKKGKLYEAQTYLENIAPENLLGKNYLAILSLKIKEYQNREWDDADSSLLRSIAYSCSTTGGFAVTMAREMLPFEEAYRFEHEIADAYCAQERASAQTPPPYFTALSLWPNPVQGVLHVGFPAPFSGELSIITLSGKTIQTISVKDLTQTELNTRLLDSGTIHYLLQTTLGKVETQKFSIIH